MKFAIYARRSEEKDTGESIDNQLKICKRYIKLKFGDDAIIDEFFDDDFSGKNTKRPNFNKMMKLIRGGAYNYLAFWKLDRVSRNALDFLSLNSELQKLGVNLISITEGFDPSTATGKLMMTILASVAEMERKNISLRVSTAMIENAKKGRWGGGNCPFGYISKKINEKGVIFTYLAFSEKIEIAKYIFEDFKTTKSFRGTSRNLKEKYNVNKTPVDIKKILTNPVYVKSSEKIRIYFEKQGFKVYGEMNGNGMLSYGKEDNTSEDGKRKRRDNNECVISVGRHEGIISDSDFIAISELVKNAKIGKPIKSKNTFLTPLVHCAICGSYMRTKTMIKANRKYLYLVCNEKDSLNSKCINKSIKITELENDVLDRLEFIYLHKDEFTNKTQKSSSVKSQLDKLIKQSEKKQKEIKNLVRKSAQNEDLEDIYADGIRELKAELKEIELTIEECRNQIILESATNDNKDVIINSLKGIKDAINNTDDMERKNLILRSVVKRIEVNALDKTFDIELCT
jgi:DNA invertase Pin-like site-specific DNA recombinase